MKKNNKKWYSIIVIIVIIWFLTVLTSWVFKLVMNEMKDNRTIWDYIKTYAWAESWQELSLLWIKEVGYPYIKDLAKNNNVLQDCDSFTNKNNCVNLSFTNNWKVKSYGSKILNWETHIIPLFYLKDDWNSSDNITNISLDWDNLWEVSWWIVNKDWKWIWWNGKFSETDIKSIVWQEKVVIDWNEFIETKVKDQRIDAFLASWEEAYLTLVAWADSDYKLVSDSDFVSPELKIISSWEVGNFKTNIETSINLADLNSLSKYSIFSP